MWTAKWALFLALQLLVVTGASSSPTSASINNSYWYDWGWYGAYPQMSYESFGGYSPWTNVLRSDSRCNAGYVFIEPRGLAVTAPGPIILDGEGNLVWMETKWGQAMDVKVQSYQGSDYITFWHGSDNGTFGQGYYLMLDSSYEVFKNITPVGDFQGDLHEFLITDQGTALMTIYEKMPYDLSSYDITDGWVIDSLFQEMDIATGDLLFQWRASDYFAIEESLAPIKSFGKTEELAFDFFHINSISKDAAGDYLISSRYMCALICVNHTSGDLIWQLGGLGNDFTDLSEGAATDFSWQHHASWHDNETITVFDNGAYDRLESAKYSRGLILSVDQTQMTATLLQDYIPPQGFLAGSQGSVQLLADSDTVLVGWGHTPAYTEFTMDGEVLCDVHIGAVNLDSLGWCKNYRTFKYPWVGHPKSLPDIAMRPRENSVYVSWNGATEVDHWLLQSNFGPDNEAFQNHDPVAKKTFETRIALPNTAKDYVRVAAVDKNGNILAYSKAVSKHDTTAVNLMVAPPRRTLGSYIRLVACGIVVGILCTSILIYFRVAIRRGLTRLWQRSTAFRHKYQALPTN